MWGKLRESISVAAAVRASAASRTTTMNPQPTLPVMARSRSPRKQVAPLSTPRRKTGASPESLRISAASLSTRLAICFGVNALRNFFLNRDLVAVAFAVGDLEFVRNLNAGHPDDRAIPDQKRDSIADARRDFTINENVFQLLFMRKAKGLEAVAVAAVPYREARLGAFGELDGLAAGRWLSADSDDGAGNPGRLVGGELDLERRDWLSNPSEDVALQLQVFGDRHPLAGVHLRGESLNVDTARIGIEPCDVPAQQRLAQ